MNTAYQAKPGNDFPLTDQVRALTEECQHTRKEFENFAYIISHDLQAPLRRIVSYSGLLCEDHKDKLDEKERKYFTYLINSGLEMQNMIEGLLLYSRVDSRKQPFTQKNIGELLEHAFRECQEQIATTGALIEVTPGLPEIGCDSEQIIRVFTALLDNAMKFQRPGNRPGIKIESGRYPGGITVSVRDNGLGIRPAKTEEIFQIFRRLNKPEDYPGLGMGLTLTKKIMERHGGSIEVTSQPGAGSIFTLKFTDRSAHE